MDLNLEGKRAIITGGSRGIGRAIARQLSLEGVTCVVCSRDEARASVAARELAELGGAAVMGAELELRDEASIEAMVADAAEMLGGVDILVNSGASVSGYVAEDFASITGELMADMFLEKVVGTLRCCRAVAPHMRALGGGSIVNICGHTARVAGAIGAGSRNSAMVNLTKNLSVALGRDGIRVNAIHPATTVTEGLLDRVAHIAARRGIGVEDYLENASRQADIGRIVTADEVAFVAVMMASPLCAGVTGEVLAVTGGFGSSVYF